MKMLNKNKMRNGLILIALSSFMLEGCATPGTAPSWPSGNERPINKAPIMDIQNNEVKK